MTIEELKQLSDDLSLVCNVMPHYSRGRQEGLSDEETARRAQDAFNRADNYIVDEIERLSDPKSISDGYHTFGELYEHRTALFASLCRAYPEQAWIADKHADGTMYDDSFLAGIDTPDGPYTYHCNIDKLSWFDGIRRLEFAPEWDGHEPKDYPRLFSLSGERLSVGDEEIIEAIEGIIQLRKMTGNQKKIDACCLAIRALRAYRKPEPCEWCADCEDWGDGLSVPRTGGFLQAIDFSFCPNCGAELEVEG